MQIQSFSRDEFQKFYDEYKQIHEKKQADYFFTNHSQESWFRDKYDPELTYKWEQEKKNMSTILAQKFVEQFVEGSLDVAHSLRLD